MSNLSGNVLGNAEVVQSADADNATATATATAPEGQRLVGLGVLAHYSVAVAAIKTITIKFGTTEKFKFRWDFNNGPCALPFPGAVRPAPGENLVAELEASGAGSTLGQISLFFAYA